MQNAALKVVGFGGDDLGWGSKITVSGVKVSTILLISVRDSSNCYCPTFG